MIINVTPCVLIIDLLIKKSLNDDTTDIKINGLSQDETTMLISLIETSKPLWDHRLSLGDRSEVVKNNLWNEIFSQFEGKIIL